MARISSVLAALVTVTGLVSAADDMGPAAFMWPADRVWSAAADNTAPCGSIAGAGNRTQFPMTNGKIALVAQDESYDIELSVSYLQDPKSNTDFNPLIDSKAFRELDLGHTCVPIADAPSSVKAGANATLQIRFIADFDKPENQTFYACADITYVPVSEFDTSIPCFNATQPDPNAGHASPPKKKKSGLSGGAIAGIVIGVLVAVGLVAAAFFIYGRKQQRLVMLRREHSARGVKWEEQPGRASASTASVKMQNLAQ
ncbi:hypothetical protein PT974_07182 [Cladobotryum mycophilum]|uniref:Copper acquisition factor BIM1-like domain-containing protein n=1 Tax=Cladobotryum mycophilum TaxID=491253 RepID=A0ABR0SNK4_9HYPO